MTKHRTRGAIILLIVLFPFSLFAREKSSGVPDKSRARLFSLSIGDAPAAQTTPIPRAVSTPAPSTPPPPEKITFRNLSHDFLKDAGQIWSYPAHIRTRDILPIVGLAAATGFLIGNDEAIFRSFKDYHDGHAWVRDVSPVITIMGSYGAWGTVGAFLCVGLIARNDKAVETAALASSAMLQSGLVVQAMKLLAGRQRPSWADGADHWAGPAGMFKRFEHGQYSRYDSFPSGHTVTAFSLATVLAMQYRDSVWVPILSYSVATGVGLSRLTEHKHWLSDVLVGGVLGHVIGRLVVRNHRSRYHLTPAVGVTHGSLAFAVSFFYN
jgi:membrane-associated phospholipid phosphatase